MAIISAITTFLACRVIRATTIDPTPSVSWRTLESDDETAPDCSKDFPVVSFSLLPYRDEKSEISVRTHVRGALAKKELMNLHMVQINARSRAWNGRAWIPRDPQIIATGDFQLVPLIKQYFELSAELRKLAHV